MGLAGDDPDTKARLFALRQGLEKLGWVEGHNVRIDYRFAPAGARAEALAKELVALRPDVILSNASPATAALQRETSVIPIVFTGVADPIGSGFVASLARPGGNITGFLLFEASITGKWLAMLKEVAPDLTAAYKLEYDNCVSMSSRASAPVESAGRSSNILEHLKAGVIFPTVLPVIFFYRKVTLRASLVEAA
jgi:ABC transporter substrate binding protein